MGTCLVLLDLSSAFDMVITTFCSSDWNWHLKSVTWHWAGSTATCSEDDSKYELLASWLPPCPRFCAVYHRDWCHSVLGAILFLLYTADLLSLIDDRSLQAHLYADDTQPYGFCPLSESLDLQTSISRWNDEVVNWMNSNQLQLNTNKKEFIWLSSSCQVHQLPWQPLQVGWDLIAPVAIVRDLGIYLDSDMSVRSHVLLLFHHSTPPTKYPLIWSVNGRVTSTFSAGFR